MSGIISFVHRGVAPFLTGVLMAGAAVVDMESSVPLMLAAMIFGYASLPTAERLTRRLLGEASEV